MREWTGYEFDQLADQHGFVVVYPDGYKHTWNDCHSQATFAAPPDSAVQHVTQEAAKNRNRNSEPGPLEVKARCCGYDFRLGVLESRVETSFLADGGTATFPDRTICFTGIFCP